MSDAQIAHCVVDVVFTCSCGQLLCIIDRHQREICEKCGAVYGVDVRIVDVEREETGEAMA